MASRLPIVPVATKTAASLPIADAARASRRLMLGSSPKTSSPTSASAIARRMSGPGMVSVSERRSTGLVTGLFSLPRGRGREGPTLYELLVVLSVVGAGVAGSDPGTDWSEGSGARLDVEVLAEEAFAAELLAAAGFAAAALVDAARLAGLAVAAFAAVALAVVALAVAALAAAGLLAAAFASAGS